ncbi:MAG: TolC family protein [Bacteroidales bacterium]|nr:TolC family protein [Bacteroidales bacterium]
MKRPFILYIVLCLCFPVTAFARDNDAPAVSGAHDNVLTLDRCRQLCWEHSADVRNASLDVAAARLQKQEAIAEYFPSISASAASFHAYKPLVEVGITDILGPSDMAFQIQQQVQDWAAPYDINTQYRTLNYGYTGGVQLKQPIYAGGRIVTGNRLAALGEQAAVVKSDLQKRTSAEKVDKEFFQILALQEKSATLDGLQKLLDTLQRDVQGAVAAGVAVNTDLSEVMLKQSELKAGRNKLKMGLRLAKMNLLNGIGVEYNPYVGLKDSTRVSLDDFVFQGSFNDIVPPAQAYVDEEKAAAALSESRLLQMQVEAKSLERRMVLGEALPSLGLGGFYGFSKMVTSPRWNGALYAMLQIPITDWGKNSRKLERLKLEVQKAQNQRDYLSDQLVLQMRQLYIELSCAYDNMQIARDAEEIASTRLAQIRSDYSAGMTTVSEVLKSETAYRTAQESRIDATLDYLTALEAYRLRCR